MEIILCLKASLHFPADSTEGTDSRRAIELTVSTYGVLKCLLPYPNETSDYFPHLTGYSRYHFSAAVVSWEMGNMGGRTHSGVGRVSRRHTVGGREVKLMELQFTGS